MTKPLATADFRSMRFVLEPKDFGLSVGVDAPPSDLVNKEVWHEIFDLFDDVAIRTSSHNGSELRTMWELWGDWIEAVSQRDGILPHVVLDASDELQCAVANTVIGFYRQAIGCLRNVLESVAIGAYCHVLAKLNEFRQWREGQVVIRFGQACDGLSGSSKLRGLKLRLHRECQDSLFDPKTKNRSGGWARRLYDRLSDFSHARPGFANSDLWQSNGPVYDHDAFRSVFELFTETGCLCCILIDLSQTELTLDGAAAGLFEGSATNWQVLASCCYAHLRGQHASHQHPGAQ